VLSWSRAQRLATFAGLFLAVVLVQSWMGALQVERGLHSDDAAHFMNGLLIRDYLTHAMGSDPMRFAEQYYLHYPKIAPLMWPPLFHVLLGFSLLAGFSAAPTALFLVGLAAAWTAFRLHLIVKHVAGSALAFAAAGLFLTTPLVMTMTSVVMLDVILAALAIEAAYWLARFVSSESWRHAVLHLPDVDDFCLRHAVHLRPRRRGDVDRADRADRSGHESLSDGNEGALERLAEKCVQHLGIRGYRLHRSHPVDTGQRDIPAAMTCEPTTMHKRSERGIALILTLFLMTAMSVLAASLMFLSQTETYASMNYRMMSQARYAAEAGVHKAANFLLDSTQYAVPGTTADPLTNYDRTVSPVKYNGQPVILSAVSTQASNYPVGSVQTAFNNAAKGTLTAGNATLSYGAYAKLMSMQTFESYGGGQAVVQTWEITADGTLAGSRPATEMRAAPSCEAR
jgi:Tfp pilus assembly protein PilX